MLPFRYMDNIGVDLLALDGLKFNILNSYKWDAMGFTPPWIAVKVSLLRLHRPKIHFLMLYFASPISFFSVRNFTLGQSAANGRNNYWAEVICFFLNKRLKHLTMYPVDATSYRFAFAEPWSVCYWIR